MCYKAADLSFGSLFKSKLQIFYLYANWDKSTTAVIKERIWKIETLIAMKPYFLFCGFLFSRTSDSFVNGLIVYIRSSNSYQFLLAILIAENIINAPRLSIFRAPRDITPKHQVTLVWLDTRTDSTIL